MKKVILNYIAYVMLALVVPCYLISTRYQVFEKIKTPKVQILGGFTIISVVVWFFLRGQVNDMFDKMKDSKLKSIVKRTKGVLTLLLILLILMVAKVHMDNAIFILIWSLVSNLVASYFYVEYMDAWDQLQKKVGDK